MFNLFKGEIEKNIKRKTLIALSIVFVVLLVVMAIGYHVISDIFSDSDILGDIASSDYGDLIFGEDGLDIPEDFYTTNYLSREELIEMITVVEEKYNETSVLYKENKVSYYSEFYKIKSQRAVLKYALEKGYYDKEVYILGMNYSGGGIRGTGSAEGFLSTYAAIVMVICVIYGMVIGAGMYNEEYKSGTIKFVLTRPITKNALTTAKVLALYAILTVMYLVPVFISFLYGCIVYGSEATQTIIYSFNATSAGSGTVGGIMFGTIVSQIVKMLVMATISFTLGTITRKQKLSIIVSILLWVNITSIVGLNVISAFLVWHSADFMSYFGVEDFIPFCGNFVTELFTTIVWVGGLLAATYIVVNKRDVV